MAPQIDQTGQGMLATDFLGTPSNGIYPTLTDQGSLGRYPGALTISDGIFSTMSSLPATNGSGMAPNVNSYVMKSLNEGGPKYIGTRVTLQIHL